MSSNRIPTTVEVIPLNQAALEAEVSEQLGRAVKIGGQDWGYVETPDGVFAVGTEGVGPSAAVTDEDKVALDLYDEVPGAISIVPSAQVNLGPEDLKTWKASETVNLEQWVRTFGHRLEANYEQHRRALEKHLS